MVINRKVSADKQKDQVPDGTPNCKLKPNPIFTIYLSFVWPISSPEKKKSLRARQLGINKLSQGSLDLVLQRGSPWRSRIWDLDTMH